MSSLGVRRPASRCGGSACSGRVVAPGEETRRGGSCRHAAVGIDDGARDAADPFDLDPHDVARDQEDRRDAEDADAIIKSLAKTKENDLTAALEHLARDHETAARSYRLVCVAGAWQFVTQPEFSPWLKALVGVKAAVNEWVAIDRLDVVRFAAPETTASS